MALYIVEILHSPVIVPTGVSGNIELVSPTN